MRVLSGVLAAAISVGMLISIEAFGQTAAFKCARPGTTVEYSDGSRVTWVAQEGNTCRLQSKRTNGEEVTTVWYAPTASLAANASQAWATQLQPSTLWPLAVGKKIQAQYHGAGTDAGYSGSWIHTIIVEKSEKVTTKAGTFDTFVVNFQQEGLPPNNWKSTLRQWYAPELGVTVKFDYFNNRTQKSNGEAIAIRQ